MQINTLGDVQIRNCEPANLIPVMEINLKTLPEHYSDYFYETLLRELPEAFLVAEISKNIIGYMMCKTEYGFSNFKKLGFIKKGHMVSVAVLPEYRKKGIGKSIIAESIQRIRKVGCAEFYLEVRSSNFAAVKMYESLGFSIRQRLNAYYRDGEGAYMMSIDLKP
ncbi:MAG: N-acetyltransferase [Candidatus Nitrosoabyssus spongiisocia]|nr:MAG: N-acetyltransferase [Nitrosopumilaceae archaeon AB1(1)]